MGKILAKYLASPHVCSRSVMFRMLVLVLAFLFLSCAPLPDDPAQATQEGLGPFLTPRSELLFEGPGTARRLTTTPSEVIRDPSSYPPPEEQYIRIEVIDAIPVFGMYSLPARRHQVVLPHGDPSGWLIPWNDVDGVWLRPARLPQYIEIKGVSVPISTLGPFLRSYLPNNGDTLRISVSDPIHPFDGHQGDSGLALIIVRRGLNWVLRLDMDVHLSGWALDSTGASMFVGAFMDPWRWEQTVVMGCRALPRTEGYDPTFGNTLSGVPIEVKIAAVGDSFRCNHSAPRLP